MAMWYGTGGFFNGHEPLDKRGAIANTKPFAKRGQITADQQALEKKKMLAVGMGEQGDTYVWFFSECFFFLWYSFCTRVQPNGSVGRLGVLKFGKYTISQGEFMG